MPNKNNLFEIRDNIAIFNINAPITNKMEIMELSHHLSDFENEIDMNAEIRVITVLGTHEQAFSFDQTSHRPASANDDALSETRIPLAESLSNLEQPVIAAIMGDAVGQGLELILACDIRIAAETSHFGLPHIKKGLIPSDGGTQRLSRLVGRGKALEMILTGKDIDAQEALRIGLVNMILPKKDVTQVALDMAGEMALKSPISLKYAKEAIYKGMDITLEQGLRLETDL